MKWTSATEDANAVRSFEYEPSKNIERTRLRGGPIGGLVIAPGQADLFNEDWEVLFDYLRAGKSRLVINVVAWGYHSLNRVSFQDDKHYQAGMSKEEFLAEYLASWRAKEEAGIQKLAPHLMTAKRRVRMITLITKQELWWNERRAVQKHYEEGVYGQTIQQVQENRQGKFVHVYLPISLVSQNFNDGRGELLASTTQGYDDVIQTSYQKELIGTVLDFARR